MNKKVIIIVVVVILIITGFVFWSKTNNQQVSKSNLPQPGNNSGTETRGDETFGDLLKKNASKDAPASQAEIDATTKKFNEASNPTEK